jgi:hypothetical protein
MSLNLATGPISVLACWAAQRGPPTPPLAPAPMSVMDFRHEQNGSSEGRSVAVRKERFHAVFLKQPSGYFVPATTDPIIERDNIFFPLQCRATPANAIRRANLLRYPIAHNRVRQSVQDILSYSGPKLRQTVYSRSSAYHRIQCHPHRSTRQIKSVHTSMGVPDSAPPTFFEGVLPFPSSSAEEDSWARRFERVLPRWRLAPH